MSEKKDKSDKFLDSIFKNVSGFFSSKVPSKKNKKKKSVIKQNIKASNNKPELVKLLDETSAREKNSNPEGIFDAIADMIVENIVEDMKKKDKSNIKGIADLFDAAEENFVRSDEEDLHKNRVNIKEKLRSEYYNGSLLPDDDMPSKSKKNKNNNEKKDSEE